MARGTGRGELEKRGKRWRARYTAPDGTRPSKTFDTKELAQRWLTSQLVTIDLGKWRPARTLEAEKFGPYATAWVNNRRTARGTKLAARTRSEYHRYLEAGLATFTDLRMQDITPALVRKWHAGRVAAITQERRDMAEEQGKDADEARYTGETTAAREARLLRAVLNTALQDRILDMNPVPSNLAKSQTKVPHRIPTPEELSRILHHLPEEWKAPVVIAAFGGLRIGEWKALRRQDITQVVDATTGATYYVINVTRQAQYDKETKRWEVVPPKSEEGVREVALPAHVTNTITNHLANHTGEFPGSLLFPPIKGVGFLDNKVFYRRWNAAKALAGVPDMVRGHDLRGYAGTMFAQQGATLKETQAQLGHRTVAAAMAYQSTTGRAHELVSRIPALPEYRPGNVSQLRKDG